mmetsp:Transcript_16507/g.53479  ORF Transcript_16507/g.53479 Transcript_16507/m.53479 type:complete len:349 (-) Transcript_16507:52-1098(-)
MLRHLEPALLRDRVLVEVGWADAEPLDVGRGQVDRVVRHVLRALHVDGEDLEPVRVGVEQPEDRHVECGAHLVEEEPRGHVGLPLAGDDDARVVVVEAVLREPHEGGVLLDEQDELRVAAHVCDAVDRGRDRLPAHAHLCAVDGVAVVLKDELADDDALLRRDHVEGRAGAADHAGDVVEDVVGLGLLLEELDVGVEEVALCDVDALRAELEHNLHQPGGDRRLARRRGVGEDALEHLLLEDHPVELLDVHLVGCDARGHHVGEAVAAHDGGDRAHADCLDLRRHVLRTHVLHLFRHARHADLLERALARRAGGIHAASQSLDGLHDLRGIKLRRGAGLLARRHRARR